MGFQKIVLVRDMPFPVLYSHTIEYSNRQQPGTLIMVTNSDLILAEVCLSRDILEEKTFCLDFQGWASLEAVMKPNLVLALSRWEALITPDVSVYVFLLNLFSYWPIFFFYFGWLSRVLTFENDIMAGVAQIITISATTLLFSNPRFQRESSPR